MTANSIYIYIQETLFETDKNIGACALTGRPANPHTPRLPAQECLWEEPMKHENKRQQYQAGYYKTHPCRDSFPCRVCGRLVTPEGAGSSHRNHCPNCLYSLHVDITPGDRAADCGGIMEPVAVWVRKNGEWALIHRCRRCGALSANRVAADDNPMKLMSIALRPLCAPPSRSSGSKSWQRAWAATAACHDPQMKNGRRPVSFGASAVFRVKNRYDGITREMRSTQRARISDRSPVSLYKYPGHRLRSPFEWLRADCMLPEPANDVLFFAFH